MGMFLSTTGHLRETEGLDVVAVAWRPKVAGNGDIRIERLGSRFLGIRLGDRPSGSDGTVGASEGRRRHPRSERVDELEHVIGKLAGAVGGRQALDQLEPPVAVLEGEELLVVTLARMSSARSVCLRAVGFKTTRTRGLPWPKSNIAHWSNLAPK
jgi:hypothetical protein